ncbi:lipase [Plectosphaerella plurivora]|uniref:Lipase n=1 Tax=Plectosphaerella plurivora TaxID=936078 RepID=A0A9P9A643_9PEZI|nr:lipase [Plectosphaerella plurivora]
MASKSDSIESILQSRIQYENICKMCYSAFPTSTDVHHTSTLIETYDGNDVGFHHFLNEKAVAATSPQPAVLYFHGGGMIAGSVGGFTPLIAYYASLSGISFFAVDYRLAPENPAPTGVEDGYSGLIFLVKHAMQWNVDPSRICLMGDSAGGLVAAACALLARDRELVPKVAMQLLIYPMLDDRTTLPADAPLWPFLSYKPADNAAAWAAFLQDKGATAYTVPAKAEDLTGLPRAYVEVGGFDLFFKEDLDYATRLAEAGVEVELRAWPRLPHGFDLAFGDPATTRAINSRMNALASL